MNKKFHRIIISGVVRRLPLFEAAPGVKIALFNTLGDTEIIERSARALAKKVTVRADVLVTPEVKSIPLAHELSSVMKIPYIVVRKTLKPYMVGALSCETVSITTGKPQTLHLDGKDRLKIRGKRVILVDDVVSTGSTLEALRVLMKKAGAKVVAEAAILTEGDQNKWSKIISLGHLPVWVDDHKQ